MPRAIWPRAAQLGHVPRNLVTCGGRFRTGWGCRATSCSSAARATTSPTTSLTLAASASSPTSCAPRAQPLPPASSHPRPAASPGLGPRARIRPCHGGACIRPCHGGACIRPCHGGTCIRPCHGGTGIRPPWRGAYQTMPWRGAYPGMASESAALGQRFCSGCSNVPAYPPAAAAAAAAVRLCLCLRLRLTRCSDAVRLLRVLFCAARLRVPPRRDRPGM